MKKVVSLILAGLLCLSCAACSGNEQSEVSSEVSSAVSSEVESSEVESEVESEAVSSEVSSEVEEGPLISEQINVAALKGPTAMGMVWLMDNDELGNYTLAAAADEVTPKLVQGELDIAAVPANLASVLYNNTEGGVQVLAVNTLGVLYIVESGDTVQSVEDLRGKTIYSSGKGSTPEYALNYMLSQNGIDPETDVTIEWKSEHSECVAALAAEENAIAMLPQPFVTTAQTKNENIRVALDLTEEWEKLSSTSENPATLITGVVVARKEFCDEHPELVEEFLAAYEQSVDYALTDVDGAAALIGSYEIVTEEVAKKALPYCNITFIKGAEMKEKLSSYLNTLFEQNPKAVGGTLPADDFYYGG